MLSATEIHLARTNGCPSCGAELTHWDAKFEYVEFACGSYRTPEKPLNCPYSPVISPPTRNFTTEGSK